MEEQNGVPDMAVLPGLKMRKARTELSISVEAAAASLGLTERMLKALEADDYSKLPAAVYVRGYIKSYCSLLNIDASAILLAFEKLIEMEKQQSPEDEKKPLLEDLRLRIIIACTVTILLLLIAVAIFAESLDGKTHLGDQREYGGDYVCSEVPTSSLISQARYGPLSTTEISV
ncbi:MAG: helix-turn-helix domain-containing protein [Porticoccaceae bacterium]|nr:helix-turn-helix domain-containing protein [Porticoccaceae bacterium]